LRKPPIKRFLKYLPLPNPPLRAGEGENLAQLKYDANQISKGGTKDHQPFAALQLATFGPGAHNGRLFPWQS
jgi:hypothetical protein